MITVSKAELDIYLPEIKRISGEAGSLILGIYNSDPQNWGVVIKSDNSPVTEADKASHDYLAQALHGLAPHIPLVSEENDPALIQTLRADPNVQQGTFIAVDPLDGTKEFLGRTGAFAINIILMEKFEPKLALSYSPALDVMYFAVQGGGAWRQDGANNPVQIKTRPAPQRGELTTLFNAKHGCAQTYSEARMFLAGHGIDVPAQPDGVPNRPRMLRVADGEADINVSCGKGGLQRGEMGYVWDYATSLILDEAGGVAVDLHTRQKLRFADAFGRVSPFVALGDRDLARRAFPGLQI